ncbi:stressosome-associated protein Prli42 [Listeria costaricensis]|nr:stressosome-associated protein Prli42 [Listeria costaricensis]
MSNKKFVRFVVILMLVAIILSSIMTGVLMFW